MTTIIRVAIMLALLAVMDEGCRHHFQPKPLPPPQAQCGGLPECNKLSLPIQP